MNKAKDSLAKKAVERINSKWTKHHPRIANALRGLSWKKVHRMEGVTPY